MVPRSYNEQEVAGAYDTVNKKTGILGVFNPIEDLDLYMSAKEVKVVSNNFYKENYTDKIWWIDNAGTKKGEFLFSFDKKKVYNLFSDYPHNLTPEEVEIFDKENPYWSEFFKERR